jgi:molecular chaperone GrpE
LDPGTNLTLPEGQVAGSVAGEPAASCDPAAGPVTPLEDAAQAAAQAPSGSERRDSALVEGGQECRISWPGQPAGREPMRDQILRRFEAWLDEALSNEAPPEGIDGDILSRMQGEEPQRRPAGLDGCDLYSLWSALMALTGEIGLQGRAFKQLCQTLGPVQELTGHVGSVLGAHQEALGAARAIAEEARDIRQDRDEQVMRTAHQAACREFLDLLLDLRDRLDRGWRCAREHVQEACRLDGAGWLRRTLGQGRRVRRLADATAALAKGYELSLSQLEESLGGLGVGEIACEGLPFDAGRMKAVDVADRPDVPEGTVLEVYRTGYEWHGLTCRLAEVKVARGAADLLGPGAQPEGIEFFREDQHE